MLKNYLTIALRQLRRQRMYSVIKVGGFALSIAACLLIALWIRDELSYDRDWANANRLFRVVSLYNGEKGVSAPGPFAPTLASEFPEVEAAGSLMPNDLFYGAGSNELKRAGDAQNTYEEGFTYADQGVMKALQIPLIYGTPTHLLDAPLTMVITQRKAEKYFPHQDPVGKTFILNNDKDHPYKVTGVIPDFSGKSHLPYDFYLTMKGAVFFPGEENYWGANNHDAYILLKPGVNPNAFAARMYHTIFSKYIIPVMKSYGVKDPKAEEAKGGFELQPVGDIYLKSYNIHDDLPRLGDIRLVWMFGGIAAFILLIACINFINLSTARSAGRAKEVGLRKVVGSQRSSLIAQFLAESMVFSLLSFFLALILARILLPFFNHLAGKSLDIPWGEWWFAPLILLSAGVVGLVAGLYPAFYLSHFKPIKVLKGQLTRGSRNASLRSVLVVFQFTTSIMLIIGTFVIYRQMEFILHKKVGFDKDQVMIVQGTGTLSDKDVRAFKEDLTHLSQVKSVSIGDYLPVNGGKRNGNSFYKWSTAATDAPYFAQFWIADYDYISTMGMHLVEGRNFSRDMAGDTAAMIVNQMFVKKLHLTGDPVGQEINHFGQRLHIIGVLEDFNSESFRDTVNGVALFLGISPGMVSIKTQTADVTTLIPQVTAIWKKAAPDQPIRFTFLDQSYKRMYADVERDGNLLTSFSILAVVIACLGLFALATFMAEQRKKELGIRKVLGASVGNLTALMSKDFVVLVGISVLIASPIAWWGMQKWLQEFVYREEISWWIIAVVGIIAMIIALGTVAFQSMKAALENPIKSLRSE